ncbi:MAG: Lin0512 family protein [Candidatus Puniceispirillum sp.]
MKRIILEMGTGNDLYGADYTKAACRAVQDALHHSSLILFRSLGFDHADMVVKVTIGVQDPEKVDCAVVAATLPRGQAEVTAVKGGQNVIDPDHDTVSVIATAAVEAYLEIDAHDWVLSAPQA